VAAEKIIMQLCGTDLNFQSWLYANVGHLISCLH